MMNKITKTSKFTLLFLLIFNIQTNVCSAEDTKVESLLTSDKMQKSFCLKLLGLMSACYGFQLIKSGIDHALSTSFSIVRHEMRSEPMPYGEYRQYYERPLANLFDNHTAHILYKLQVLLGGFLVYKGYDFIANSDKVTENNFGNKLISRCKVILKYTLNKLTFDRYSKAETPDN